MRHSVLMVMGLTLASTPACSNGRQPVTPDAPPPVDAAPPPDSAPQPQPLTACEAQVEPVDLGVTEPIERGTFYASAFYFRTRTGVQRRRLGGTTQTLVRDGQLYPTLGAAATLQVHPADGPFEFQRPGGGLDCGPSVLIPLSLDYRTHVAGSFGGEVVVLVDDLTQEITPVLAAGDMYDGERVDKVSVVASYGACGRVVLQVQLASGRTLLVSRDPQSRQLRTLLTIAKPGGFGGGQPIDGATDRFLGFWNYGSLEADQLTFFMSVDNGAKERLGYFLGSLELSSGKITCRITDADLPCATRRPSIAGSQNPWVWAQNGDTAASTDSVLTVVHGDSVERQIDPAFGVLVCKSTGDVYFPRSFQNPQLGVYVNEVYVLRRTGAIERVTRNIELAIAHGTTATNFDGYALTDACDVVQHARTPTSDGKIVIYWADGVFAILPTAPTYSAVGYEGSTSIPMLSYTDGPVLVHQPSGNCKVPADVFPAPAR